MGLIRKTEGPKKCLSCGMIFYERTRFNWIIFLFLLLFFGWLFFIPPIWYWISSHKIECPRCKSKMWRTATVAEVEEDEREKRIEKTPIRVEETKQPTIQTIPLSPQPTTLPPPPPKIISYQKEIEKFQKALSVLENQYSVGEISKESYTMAKASLERNLQTLTQHKDEVDKAKKSILEGIERSGSISKADLLKDFDIPTEIANEALEQLLDENIIEKTETGERYRLKGKTKKCPYCRRSIHIDLSVCPLCGSIIET